jgi:hypothetical protein
VQLASIKIFTFDLWEINSDAIPAEILKQLVVQNLSRVPRGEGPLDGVGRDPRLGCAHARGGRRYSAPGAGRTIDHSRVVCAQVLRAVILRRADLLSEDGAARAGTGVQRPSETYPAPRAPVTHVLEGVPLPCPRSKWWGRMSTYKTTQRGSGKGYSGRATWGSCVQAPNAFLPPSSLPRQNKMWDQGPATADSPAASSGSNARLK